VTNPCEMSAFPVCDHIVRGVVLISAGTRQSPRVSANFSQHHYFYFI